MSSAYASLMLIILLDLQDGRNTFLRNVELFPNDMALQLKDRCS
jgi:hypothetical protein